MSSNSTAVCSALLVALVLGACSSTASKAPPTPAPASTPLKPASPLKVNQELLSGMGQDLRPGLTLDKEGLRTARSIYFQPRSEEMTSESSIVLAQHARYINSQPDLRLSIIGFADDGNSPEDSLKLARSRAEQTRSELLNIGVPSLKVMSVQWKGLELEKGEKTWPGNRRVDLIYETVEPAPIPPSRKTNQ